MQSFSRVLFLTIGSVCLLIVPLFWVSLALDYKALENILIVLSNSKFVGYPIPELFGASMSDSVVSQVFRMKVFISLFFLVYSLLLIGLSSFSGKKKRMKFLFGGISIPLFLLIVGFWVKFVSEDHIINYKEKHELFLATSIGLIISILLFAYSLISNSPKKSIEYKFNPIHSKKRSNLSEEEAEKNSINRASDLSVNASEVDLNPSDDNVLVGSVEKEVDETKLHSNASEESNQAVDSAKPVSEVDMKPTEDNALEKSVENEVNETESESGSTEKSKLAVDSAKPASEVDLKQSDDNALAESVENEVNKTESESENNEESETVERIETEPDSKVKLSSNENLSPS